MIEIIVCRGTNREGCEFDDPALKWGDDIVDPLLTSKGVAIERGRVEIDRVYTNRTKTVINLGTLEYVQPGSLNSIVDPDFEFPEKGIARNVNISIQKNDQASFSIDNSITLEINR